jgi:hypothetical protein
LVVVELLLCRKPLKVLLIIKHAALYERRYDMKRFVILVSIVTLFIVVAAPVNAKRVSIDVTGTWDLTVTEYWVDADGTVGPGFPVDDTVLILDQKPNGTISGSYQGFPGYYEYGTWEDIGNAVRYNVTNDSYVDDSLFAFYYPPSAPGFMGVIESHGFTIFKDNHYTGDGSISGFYINLSDGTIFTQFIRVYTIVKQ